LGDEIRKYFDKEVRKWRREPFLGWTPLLIYAVFIYLYC
jgi:hypothetical protein